MLHRCQQPLINLLRFIQVLSTLIIIIGTVGYGIFFKYKNIYIHIKYNINLTDIVKKYN